MPIDIASLERATLDAVAPLAVEAMPGWLLPFDESTVGRAISAVPLMHDAALPVDVPSMESRYQAQGLRAQFRVADVPQLAHVHDALRSAGFSPQQPTLTLVALLADWPLKPTTLTIRVSELATGQWESVYRAPEFNPADAQNRVRALQRGKSALYAWIADEQGPVAAGVASFSHGWASLHGLRTRVRARRQGHAQALIHTFIGHARQRNLAQCFLQVEEANTGAVNLYLRLGFQTAWRYHYWRKPA